MTPTPNPAPERVTLASVGPVEQTPTGRLLVPAYFKRGTFGRPVRRAFWGTVDPATQQASWERVTPEELQALVGRDLTGQVSVEPLDIEPKEITSSTTGEVTTIHSLTVVRMADETVEQAARLYGVVPRKPRLEVEPSGVLQAPPGFHVVGGDGEA